MLTEQDNGRTVALAIGESVSLRLSNEWLWDTPQVDGDAIALAPVDYLVDPGYGEWVAQAVTVGEAVVRTAGTPQCAGAECDGEPVDLVITFQVQG